MGRFEALRGVGRYMRGNMLVLTCTGAIGMFSRMMAFPYASLLVLELGGQPDEVGLFLCI